MANLILNNIQLLQYAEDILLIGTSNGIGWLCNQMNIALENLSKWLDQHILPIAVSKSGATLFRTGKSHSLYPNIMLNNELVPWKSEIKYLGVLVQESSNWNSFVAHTTQKAAMGLNILR